MPLKAGKGEALLTKFVVDTGGFTCIDVKVATEMGMNLKKLFEGKFPFFKVKDTLTVSLDDHSSRVLHDPRASGMPVSLLGHTALKKTVISLKDWTMTFKRPKGGDVTLPFLN